MDEASSLRLDTVTEDDRVVVIVRGDIDASTAPQLLAVVEAATEDVAVIELDLGEVGFLDSTGLSVMAATLQRLELVDGTLRLRAVPPSVMRLLRITDLLRFVEVLSERS
ncbi:MAG: STAS domain-containing protein [Actinomycetota bacterium]